MSGQLGQALADAAAGWPVHPTRPDDPDCERGGRCECKAPLTEHGLLEATTDVAVIRAWWRRWPEANVAIATGAPGPDVLDVDVTPDGSGFAALNRLKRAGLLTGASHLIRTPRGGLHVYYAGTGQPSGRLPRHHLDFKAAGGYVLAPPSRVHGKPYELIDHRAGTASLDWQAARRLLDPQRNYEPRSCARRGHLAEWVAAQPEGNRNSALYWAAHRIDPGDAGAAEQLIAAAVKTGLTEFAAKRTVASAARKRAAS